MFLIHHSGNKILQINCLGSPASQYITHFFVPLIIAVNGSINTIHNCRHREVPLIFSASLFQHSFIHVKFLWFENSLSLQNCPFQQPGVATHLSPSCLPSQEVKGCTLCFGSGNTLTINAQRPLSLVPFCESLVGFYASYPSHCLSPLGQTTQLWSPPGLDCMLKEWKLCETLKNIYSIYLLNVYHRAEYNDEQEESDRPAVTEFTALPAKVSTQVEALWVVIRAMRETKGNLTWKCAEAGKSLA